MIRRRASRWLVAASTAPLLGCLYLASCGGDGAIATDARDATAGGDATLAHPVVPDGARDVSAGDAHPSADAADAADACGTCASGSCSDGGCDPAVFLSSREYTGAIGDGGVIAADDECASLAKAAGVPGAFRAWLASADGASPASRFIKSSRPYRLLDGTLVAADFSALSKTLATSFGLTEQRTAVAFAYVWTAAERDGTPIAGGGDCSGWSTSDSAIVGGSGESDDVVEEWTKFEDIACSTKARLYCFEQRP